MRAIKNEHKRELEISETLVDKLQRVQDFLINKTVSSIKLDIGEQHLIWEINDVLDSYKE